MQDRDTARELDTLAAELVSLATFAKRAPTEHGREQFTKQADGFAQRANALGYPSIADGIGQAKTSATWHGVGAALDLVADHVRKLADERKAPVGESVAADVRAAAFSNEWEAFHRSGGPSPLEGRKTGETVPADCTGYIDELGHLAHDGATCPVHESGDVDPGDERETGDLDGPEAGAAIMLDQLASNARTALDDPCGITGLEEWRRDYGRAVDVERLDAAVRYTIAQADLIINTLNPADLDAANAAGALTVLGRHIEDVRDRLEAEDVIEKGRSMIGDAIAAALDHLDQATAALLEETDDRV